MGQSTARELSAGQQIKLPSVVTLTEVADGDLDDILL